MARRDPSSDGYSMTKTTVVEHSRGGGPGVAFIGTGADATHCDIRQHQGDQVVFAAASLL